MKDSIQKELQASIQTTLPSFSIVYETENLSSVELENIYRSLDSLAAQEISPAKANEFLIIDGGFTPEEVIADLCTKYPWITVQRVPGIGYHEAKMLGAKLATGEIVVICDSDCEYTSGWLRHILTLFRQNAEVNVAAGETSTPIRNAYEFAIAMHYFFPRFSLKEHPYETNHYFFNGVAFRRNFLLQHPFPTQIPLYRSNCKIHTYYLCDLKQYVVLKHPQARAVHEPPTLSFISWRYLLRGRDRVWRKQIQDYLSQNPDADVSRLSIKLDLTLRQKLIGLFRTFLQINFLHKGKVSKVLKEDNRRLLLLPFAIPYILWFEVLYTFGSMITYFKPNLIMELYKRAENRTNGLNNLELHSS